MRESLYYFFSGIPWGTLAWTAGKYHASLSGGIPKEIPKDISSRISNGFQDGIPREILEALPSGIRDGILAWIWILASISWMNGLLKGYIEKFLKKIMERFLEEYLEKFPEESLEEFQKSPMETFLKNFTDEFLKPIHVMFSKSIYGQILGAFHGRCSKRIFGEKSGDISRLLEEYLNESLRIPSDTYSSRDVSRFFPTNSLTTFSMDCFQNLPSESSWKYYVDWLRGILQKGLQGSSLKFFQRFF